MVKDLKNGLHPDIVILKKRFDIAMTKKLGVIRLAPTFWVQDPKINPRADHLFWASLLIGDRQGVDLAISVIAAELEEKQSNPKRDMQQALYISIQNQVGLFLATVNDTRLHERLKESVERLLPEFYPKNSRGCE